MPLCIYIGAFCTIEVYMNKEIEKNTDERRL